MTARVVVIGDALLDADVEGTSSRLCPDAPAPVVEVSRTRRRPGGAALAALLAAAAGAGEFGGGDLDVTLVAPVPEADRDELASLLGSRVRLVALDAGGRLPRKTRVRVSGQSLLRLDDGGLDQVTDLGVDDRQRLRAELFEADAVLVSDYGLGVTSVPGVRKLLASAAAGRPVVWDPHPRGTRPTAGTTVITPNASEGAGLDPESQPLRDGLAPASALAGRLQQHLGTAVALTLGSRGALLALADGGAPLVAPCPPVSGADTCGAGDAFASAVAVQLALGAELPDAVLAAVRRAATFVANGAAAGLAFDPVLAGEVGADGDGGSGGADGVRVPGEVGAEPEGEASPATAALTAPLGSLAAAAPVLDRARGEGRTIVAAGGCFDLLHAGHVELLQAAAALGDVLVVCVNSDSSVQRLKGPDRPVTPQEDRVRLLLALDCVDAVVLFDEDTPEAVLAQVQPQLWAKGADYTGRHLPEADVLAQWGGEVVLLPVLPGRSTTRLIAAARDRVEHRAEQRAEHRADHRADHAAEQQPEAHIDLTDRSLARNAADRDLPASPTERNIHVG